MEDEKKVPAKKPIEAINEEELENVAGGTVQFGLLLVKCPNCGAFGYHNSRCKNCGSIM